MSQRRILVTGLLVSLLLAMVVSSYASSQPDGLERVATDKGIAAAAQPHHLEDSPFADYSTAGVGNERVSTGVAGLAGVVITLGLASVLVLVVRRRRTDAS